MSKLKFQEKESYFDGVPQYIRDMSDEELDAFIEAETKRVARINEGIED